MVRLQLAQPLLVHLTIPADELERILGAEKLSADMFDRDDVFVSAQTMYKLVESLCEASGDPYAGVHVGETLNVLSWSPVASALSEAHSLGDFILRFTLAANKDTTSAAYTLETRRERATFSERRLSDFGVFPAHNDGFGIGYLTKILFLVKSPESVAQSVIAHVCDPGVIPPNYLNMRVASSDTQGFSLSFPAEWLLAPITRQGVPTFRPERPSAPRSAQDAVARALAPHIGDASLSASRIAALMGTSERTLARHLSAEGSSILKELTRLRMEAASQLLSGGSESVHSVAERVGYGDAGTFSRAFRRWSGQSPSQYRSMGRKELQRA